MGVPVVVPDIGGPAEIIQGGITGLQFPSQAPDAHIVFAQQIVRLLKDSSLRDKLAKAGKEHVSSTFASRKFVQIQEKYIEDLCTSRQHV
jgi:glycosyltransferase involved in cell wall biosynthesis